MQGKYIVIEGHEGTGKTSQVERLRRRLTAEGIENIEMIEPGSVPVATAIRKIVKDANLKRDAITNLLLFTCARRETWRQRAEPALARGQWVIAGRNWLSSLAIQGYGEGLDHSLVTSLTRQFTDERYLQPDLTVILAMTDETERKRRLEVRGTPTAVDAFESRDSSFQEKVRLGYEEIATSHAVERVDAAASLEDVAATIWQKIKPLL